MERVETSSDPVLRKAKGAERPGCLRRSYPVVLIRSDGHEACFGEGKRAEVSVCV